MDQEELEQLVFAISNCVNGNLNHKRGESDSPVWSDGGEEYLRRVARIYAEVLHPYYSFRQNGQVPKDFAGLAIAVKTAFGSEGTRTAVHVLLSLLKQFHWKTSFAHLERHVQEEKLRGLASKLAADIDSNAVADIMDELRKNFEPA